MKNVLILTPDRVGSTLLQRLVTIYIYTVDNLNSIAADEETRLNHPVTLTNLLN